MKKATDNPTLALLNRMFAGQRLIIRGRGPTQHMAWRLRKTDPTIYEWRMNGYPGELPAHAMWEIHWPRHHDTRNLTCPVLLHPEAAGLRENEYLLPFEPRNCACTLAWMLAYAAHLQPKPEAIFLAGCDYILPDQDAEKPSVEYWIGALREGMRVPVHFPEQSQLCIAKGYR